MNKKLFLLNLVFLFTIFSCAKTGTIPAEDIIEFRNIIQNKVSQSFTTFIESEDYKNNKKKIAKLVNSKDKVGNTPLHLAAYRGYVRMAELLIQNGAKANVKNNEGDTPLHTCISGRRDEDKPAMIAFLIRSGVGINTTNNEGDTPLDIAMHINEDLIDFLRAAGAKRSNEL